MSDTDRFVCAIKPIKQGAEPHGKQQLGTGSRTIGQAGCLLSCFVMSARHHFPTKPLELLDAHKTLVARNAFDGSGLKRITAAHALGLDVLSWERGFQIENIRKRTSEGMPAVLGIDYKPGSSSGRSSADHFVLCVAIHEDTLTYIDPATGTFETLDIRRPTYRSRKCAVAETMFLCPLNA